MDFKQHEPIDFSYEELHQKVQYLSIGYLLDVAMVLIYSFSGKGGGTARKAVLTSEPKLEAS